jgi:tryptophanyl-tRNA synthetase
LRFSKGAGFGHYVAQIYRFSFVFDLDVLILICFLTLGAAPFVVFKGCGFWSLCSPTFIDLRSSAKFTRLLIEGSILDSSITSKRKRVVSGMRPTGRLHIGHYFGALENWVRLQADPAYDCFYFIADWHALTSDYADASAVAQNTIEIATDYLAAGLDPDKSVMFQQSLVREHAELHLLLSMVTPLGWLERVPTYKEALENVKDRDLHTYGFLGYPCLQTADIVIYSSDNADLFVPVGEDQVSHVELSREIVRKFNLHNITFNFNQLQNDGLAVQILRATLLNDPEAGRFVPEPVPLEDLFKLQSEIRTRVAQVGLNNYQEQIQKQIEFHAERNAQFGTLKSQHHIFKHYLTEVLVEPNVMLTQTPRIPGLDGRKMSKSYNNTITLSESDADIRAKTKVMVTDPARKRRTDPGNPDVCPVYDWHKLFSPPPTLEWSANGCRTAGIGCIECKSAMADNLIKWIDPVRARRLEFEKEPPKVLQILNRGSDRARDVAQKTMSRVREAVFGWDSKRKEIFGAGE